MKLVILDYLWRKGWRLILAAVFEFIFGCMLAPDKLWFVQLLLVLQLVPSDLKEGIVRTLASLPLTARQISRAWWFATVGVPAAVLPAMLFAGAGFVHLLEPGTPFPAGALIKTSYMALLFLVMFFGNYGTWFELAIGAAAAGLTGYFGLAANYPRADSHFVAACVAGCVIAALQWFSAERLVPERTWNCRAAKQSKNGGGRYRAPTRYGGIPLLVQATFIRTFLIGLPIFPLLVLATALDKKVTWHDATYLTNGMSLFMYCFLPVYPLIFILVQLRYLRTLPISATKLAALTILIALLPTIVLGTLPVWAAGWISGPSAALVMLQRMAFIVAPSAICVSIAVWRGISHESVYIAVLPILVFPIVPFCLRLFFHGRDIPLILVGMVVVICLALALQLTRRLLLQSSYTYRIQKNFLDKTAWM